MAAHVFHQIYLHFTWHVKDNVPCLEGEVESTVYELLTERCRLMKGVYLHALGGTSDHVHLAVNIEPFVTISEMVQEWKGGSSHDVNKRLGPRTLAWQRGYGVVSFGELNLPWVQKYVANQRERHGQGRIHDRLERVAIDDKFDDAND